MEEKRRVLEMVRAGEIGVEEALALLEALGERPKASSPARLLRVRVDGHDQGKPVKVHVNLPLALAELLEKFLPEEAQLTLGRQGVNLKELLAAVGQGVPEGKLVEVEAEDEGKPVRILVEVV
ncbi:hypothetical protein QT17_01190 [Thermus sp. 2.9]|uniref:SHOCT-like domain-containing protein n=1 Tax=Thermus TaxID=270 RepID=UPI0005443BD5|nr:MULTISPECIES: hypothetical protein [Thermus]KHG66576.1 hypothetical protein QT17_01190 [Thermus sp. 2.9]